MYFSYLLSLNHLAHLAAVAVLVISDVGRFAVDALPQQSVCDIELGCGSPTISCPKRCPENFPCVTNDDCQSRRCILSFCASENPDKNPPPPIDHHQDKNKTWKLTEFSSGNLSGFNNVVMLYGKNNIDYVLNPVDKSSVVLQVFYPAGSINPANGLNGGILGGAGFYAYPLDLSNATKVMFAYDLYFPPGFQFVKGGKLPGLYGGHGDCTGGRNADACFSTRYMFRTGGDGELYAYLNQAVQVPEICSVPPLTVCEPPFGISLGRGAWKFTPGKWQRIQQTITLNNVNVTDGKAEIAVDGKVVLSFDKINWRTKPFGFLGIDFETFFGGKNSSWATPIDQYTYYKGFSLSILA